MILKAIKGKAAIECDKQVGRSGTDWQPDSYGHIVRDLEQLMAYRKYIMGNHTWAGLELPAAAVYRAEWMNSWLS